jgi:pimeloyl-ACP methyl ester carboxylesterase
MPSYPGRRPELLDFIARQGYWVILPRYRGTWESDGEFLKQSPHEDVLDIMTGVQQGFIDMWSNVEHRIPDAKFYLIGGSFGGAAVLLASADARVRKAVALCPVTDWTLQEDTAEPLSLMAPYVEAAFGSAYRGKKAIWQKLAKGTFYNPMRVAETLDGKKIIIVQTKDDAIVPPGPTQHFAQKTKSAIVLLKTGGHMGIQNVMEARVWNNVKALL